MDTEMIFIIGERVGIMLTLALLLIGIGKMIFTAPWNEILNAEYDEDFEKSFWLGDGEDEDNERNEPDDCYNE